jgi:hypothetical protein
MAMKITHKLSALAAVGILGAALAGCSGGGGGSLAKINGDPISLEEFNNYLETKSTVRVLVSGQTAELPVADTLAFQAMQDLVAQKLMLQLAKKAGVAPTEKEVEDEIKFKTKLQSTYIQTLKARGLTTKQIRDLVEVQLAQEKLVSKGQTVTDAELEETIKKNPNLFIEPAKATLELLFVDKPADREAADKALRSGQEFTNVRGLYDKAPANLRAQFDATRIQGGGLNTETLNEPFKSAVAKTQPGRLTDWMRAGTGWARIKVHQKFPKKDLERTPERMTFLKRQLAIQKGGKNTDVGKQVADLLKESKIDITEPSLKEPWKRFEERLKASSATTKVKTE